MRCHKYTVGKYLSAYISASAACKLELLNRLPLTARFKREKACQALDRQHLIWQSTLLVAVAPQASANIFLPQNRGWVSCIVERFSAPTFRVPGLSWASPSTYFVWIVHIRLVLSGCCWDFPVKFVRGAKPHGLDSLCA